MTRMKQKPKMFFIHFLLFFKLVASVPIIIKPFGNITVEFCTIFKKTIDLSSYVDRDAGLLQVQVLESNKSELPANNQFIGYTSDERTIYVVPTAYRGETKNGEYVIYIRVKNTVTTKFEDEMVWVKIIGLEKLPAKNFGFQLENELTTTGANQISEVFHLYKYIERLLKFFGSPVTSKVVQVYQYTFLPEGGMNINYQNCTIREAPCDDGANGRIKTKYAGIQQDNITAFKNFMSPSGFKVAKFTTEPFGPCLEKNIEPIADMGILTQIYTSLYAPWWSRVSPYPGVYKAVFPQAFTSEAFKFIRYEVVSSIDQPVSKGYFIYAHTNYTAETNTVYYQVIDETYEEIAKSPIRPDILAVHKLIEARDGRNMRGNLNIDLHMIVEFQRPLNYYVVTFAFTNFNAQGWDTRVNQMHIFVNALIQGLGERYRTFLFLKTFYLDSVTSDGNATWGLRVFPGCNFTMIHEVQTIMFGSTTTTTKISDTFKQSFTRTLQLTQITEQFLGKCKIEPPIKKLDIPALEVSFCGVFRYQIPEDAFHDNQDGGTRNLSITLYEESGSALQSTSWIDFDSQSQTIFAVPPAPLATLPNKNFIFKLNVTDSSGQTLTCDLYVNLIGSVPSTAYKITIKGDFDQQATKLVKSNVLASKVTSWMGTQPNHFLLLENQISSDQQTYMEFSQCSWRFDPCDVLKINAFKKQFFEQNGQPKATFIVHLQPEFKQLQISSSTSGPCLDDKKPTVGDPFGPFTMSLCETFDQKVPEAAFNDPEEGNARSLTLKLTPLPPATKLPEWVHFDQTSQTLTMVPYSQLTEKSYQFVLNAEDTRQQSAIQNLQVTLSQKQGEASHVVSMTFQVKTTETLNTFPSIYRQLRQDIKGYFNEQTDIVEYHSMTSGSLILNVKWSHCSISRTKCERDKIVAFKDRLISTDGGLNPTFKQGMALNFDIKTVAFSFTGICIDEATPPKVENPIPNQKIQYCSFLRYKIPENTFMDKIDGGTRKLRLSAKYQESSTLPEWLTFSEFDQEFIIFLISAKPASSNITTLDVTANTARGISVTTNITFIITDKPLSSERQNLKITVKSSVAFGSNKTLNFLTYISLLETIGKVYSLSVSNMTFQTIKSMSVFAVASVMSCGWPDCSDGEIEKMSILDLPSFDVKQFEPKFFHTSTVFIAARSNECLKEVEPPVVLQNMQPFLAERCMTFKQEITGEIFQDKSGFNNLRFLVMTVNGKPVDPQNTWVAINGVFLTGLVTHEMIKLEIKTYNITIRAINQADLHTDTWVVVTVKGALPQLFYQYDMKLTDLSTATTSTSQSSGLARQINLVNLLNQYLTYAAVNIVEYQDMVNNQFNLIWSVCPLPDKCTTEGLIESESKLLQAGQPAQGVVSLLKDNYNINSIQTKIAEVCNGPLNPPVPNQNPFSFEVDMCGGFTYQLPSTLFDDPEDGDMRKLTLFLSTVSGKKAGATHDWLLFVIDKQQIQGVPTYHHALNFNQANTELRLHATDKTGLSSSISIYLKFKMSVEPHYRYLMVLSPFTTTKIDDYHTFLNKIGSYGISGFQRPNIGFWSYRADGLGSSTVVDFFNCNFTYNPCDLYQYNQIKSQFSDQNSFAVTKFKDHMQPEFTVVIVAAFHDAPCGQNNPPVVITVPPVQVIHLCSVFRYTIPEHTFYDYEEGYTRNLALSLSGTDFTMSSFSTQFTTNTQSLFLIPSANDLDAHQSQTFVFQLKATDSSQLFQVTDLTVKIVGPYSILQECAIEIQMTRLTTAALRTNVETVEYFMQRLASYFKITENEIGVVSYKTTSSSVVFTWSYCSSIYYQQSYQSNSNALSVDHYNLQVKILKQLFDSERTVQTSFYSVFSGQFKINKVQTMFSGRCRDLPPVPTPGHHELVIYLSYGGYVTHKYLDNYFYDFEDGGAYSLALTFLNSANQSVFVDNWINVDYALYTIYAIVDDNIRASSASVFTYYLRGTDKAKQSAHITITVRKYTTTFAFAPFNITYNLQYTGVTGMMYVRQSHYLINSIVQYFSSISTYVFVLVRQYVHLTGYPQYRTITFSVARETCASKVLEKVKTVYSSQGQLDSALVSSVQQMFTFNRVYHQSSCSANPDPPSPVDPIPDFNVSYCTVFTYNLPTTLFHDTLDGETKHLALTLLDSNGMSVSSSSWVQFNSATLQLYAIAIQSMAQTQTSTTYQIQATNSRGLSNKVSFRATVDGKPYTADCRLSMRFTYKYMTENTVDVDIIWTFISLVQEYYGGSSITARSIKILSFSRIQHTSSYSISWSHCAFQYSSLVLSLQGLTQDNRDSITQIFSKYLVTSSNGQLTNQIVAQFKTAMSSHFTIESLSASYDCIEEPPVANIDKIRVFPKFCQLFNDSIPSTAFTDKRDGDTRNLKLTLLDKNAKAVSINDWLQLDQHQNVYGVVTEQVKRNAPLAGYTYFIKATDSSGRSANISYIVKVASPIKLFDAYFRMGFTSFFNELATSSHIVYTIVEKLSKLIDPLDLTGKIYVKEFNFPHSILFSYCDLSPDCTQDKVRSIAQKLRTTSGEVASELVSVMKPEIKPSTVRIDLKEGKCGAINFTIIVTPPPPVTIPECGYLEYTVPENLFTDIVGSNTRAFYLSFLTANNEPVPLNSWIRANEAGQVIYGIPTVTQMSQTMSYNIRATDPLSGYQATSTLIFNNPNYQKLKPIAQNLCLITIEMTSSYNPDYDDANLVFKFMLALVNYLGVQATELKIYSFMRWGGSSYPYHFSVTWTSCALTTTFIQNPFSEAYYNSFASILQKLMMTSNTGAYTTMNQKVVTYFKANSLYTITNIRTSNCTRPPKTPPKATRPWSVNLTCGFTQHLAPEDLFTDEQDGNTRQLTLQLLHSNGSSVGLDSWIFIDDDQKLDAMLSNTIVVQAVSAKYEFLVQATDKEGKSATTPLTVMVPSKAFVKSSVRLEFILNPIATFKRSLVLQAILTTAIEMVLKDSGVPGAKLYVSSNTKMGTLFLTNVESCDSCQTASTINLLSFKLQEEAMKVALISDILMLGMEVKKLIDIKNTECQEPAEINTFYRQIPYCSLWIYDYGFHETSRVYSYDVQFPYSIGLPLPSDSWIWYRNYTLEAYPPPSFWQQQNVGKMRTYDYSLVLKDGPDKGKFFGLAARLGLNLVPESPLPDTIDFKITLQESGPRSQFFDNFYISLVMRSVTGLVGKNGTRFVSFTVLQNNPFQFEVKWQNCSLPKDCASSDINAVNDILFNTANLKSLAIMKYFPPNITIVDIDSTCKNTPPVVLSPPLNLTIPVCGKYKYQLTGNLANDQEDEGTLAITMVLFSGVAIPRDSWIQFDSSTRTIYAMPTESITVVRNWKYLLFFTDSKGAKANLTVNVKIESEANNYYRMVLRFQSLMASSTPSLDIQCKILELIAEFTTNRVSLDTYRVITFTRESTSGELYVLIYADCSVNKTICSSQQAKLINTESSLIVSGTTNPQTSFQSFIQNFFKVQLMRREPASLTVSIPPRKLDYGVITIDKCESRIVDVRTFFADDVTLTYTVNFGNGGGPLPLNYWTQMVGDTIYIYPGLDVGVEKYKFDLVAKDTCGSSTTAAFVVDVTSVYGGGGSNSVFGYIWMLQISMNLNAQVADVFYLNQIKSTMLSFVNIASTQYSITIVSYQRLSDGFKVRFGECSIVYFPCDQSKINELIRVLFPVGSGPSAQLRQHFQLLGNVSIFEGSRQETCGTPPDGPVCSKELVIDMPFCAIMEFNVPPDLCKDPQDGNIRNLGLEFQKPTGETVQSDSWIQLNKTKQAFYGYPMYTENTKVPTNLTYLLRVKDKTGKATYVTVYVRLHGDEPTMDYKLSLTALINTQGPRDFINERICMARQISSFFGREDVNNIGYESTGIDLVKFQWTFCKQQKIPCQCQLIKTSQDRLRDDYESFKRKLSHCFVTVKGTEYQLAGFCAKTNGPESRNEIETTEVSVGQPYKRVLPDNMFVDKEDGSIRNLTLVITDRNDKRLEGATWLQVDEQNKLCGMMAYKDYIQQGYQEVNNVTYKMVAIDSCGKRAESLFNMKIVNDFPAIKYRIVFLLQGSRSGYDCKRTESLIQTIADYANIPAGEIYVDEFRDLKLNQTNGTLFTWGVQRYVAKNCDGEEFERFREKFVKDGEENVIFLERMKSKDHHVDDVYDIVDEDCLPGFPWWILILILLFLLLFLLLWLLWCCIPRCCAGPCLRACPCCRPCCQKGGKYSSTTGEQDKDEYIGIEPDEDDEDEDNLAKPIPPDGDETDGTGLRFGVNNKEIDGPEGEDILPPDYLAEREFVDYHPITGAAGGKSASGGEGGGLQTESWTDRRPLMDIHGGRVSEDRIYDKTTFGRDYYNNGRYRTENIDRVDYIVSQNNRGLSGTTSRHVIRNNGLPTDATVGGYGNRVVRFRSGNDGLPSGESKYRIKRSDLREYLARRGISYHNDVYLTESDLNEILRMRRMRHTTSKNYSRRRTHRVLRTASRLTDALVDRNYVTRQSHDHRNRRYSTGSLLRLTDATAKVASKYHLDPRNVRLRFEEDDVERRRYIDTSPDYYSSEFTSSTGESQNDRLYAVDQNYFRNRYYYNSTEGSSADDVILEPVISTRRRVIGGGGGGGGTVVKRTHEEELHDEERPTRRRRLIYRTDTNRGEDRNNTGHVMKYNGPTHSSRQQPAATRLKNRRVTTSFRNNGYNLDESSV